jgi:hypothetical protein
MTSDRPARASTSPVPEYEEGRLDQLFQADVLRTSLMTVFAIAAE